MKISDHYSLKVARQVVNKVAIPKEIKSYVCVESWSNCREQGLCIKVYLGNVDHWKNICIAQQRNSDDILIIAGQNREFDIQTNQPSEKIWLKRVHFQYKQQEKAARYIYEEIMEYIREERENIRNLKKKELAKAKMVAEIINLTFT